MNVSRCYCIPYVLYWLYNQCFQSNQKVLAKSAENNNHSLTTERAPQLLQDYQIALKSCNPTSYMKRYCLVEWIHQSTCAPRHEIIRKYKIWWMQRYSRYSNIRCYLFDQEDHWNIHSWNGHSWSKQDSRGTTSSSISLSINLIPLSAWNSGEISAACFPHFWKCFL